MFLSIRDHNQIIHNKIKGRIASFGKILTICHQALDQENGYHRAGFNCSCYMLVVHFKGITCVLGSMSHSGAPPQCNLVQTNPMLHEETML